MAVILDTNALSALADRDPGLIRALVPAARLCVTLISLGEYEYGLLASRQRNELRKWLDALLTRADTLMPDRETLPHYAAIRQELKKAGRPIPANDCWIAAIARQHRLPVVSRDQHFDSVKNLRRIDW